MSVDRGWMKRRVNPDDCSVTDEFKTGVTEFLKFSFSPICVSNWMIKCPWLKCDLIKSKDREVVTVHLYSWVFVGSTRLGLIMGKH